MSEQRAFRGVWIPADLWLNRSLSIQEKVMLIEIDSLCQDPERGCYKKNQGFAEFFGLSKNRVSEIIKSLESKGFIRIHYQRKGQEIVERNIFVIAPFDKPNPPSENCDTPFGKLREPPSENCEERGSYSRGSLEGNNTGAPSGDALSKTDQPKPKKKTKAQQLVDKVRSKQELSCLNSVGEEVLSEWAKLRTSKKASSTDRALNTIEKALAELWYQHKIHPQQAIEAQCDAGWATIKVEYLANKGGNSSSGWESTGPGWSAGLADEMGWNK